MKEEKIEQEGTAVSKSPRRPAAFARGYGGPRENRRSLDRLLRSAAQVDDESPGAMPFGFDTRVVALWRAAKPKTNGVVQLLRGVAALSAAVIVISTIAAVREANQSREIRESLTNEFAIADSAIQDEFSK